jgi:hypothetical protein
MARIPLQHTIHLESFREEMWLVLASGPTRSGGLKQLMLVFKGGDVSFRLMGKERDGQFAYDDARVLRELDDFELAVDAYNER